MAQHHIDTLKKLRAKVVEQRRAMALRQSMGSSQESVEHMVNIQTAIEAIDRAIADEQALAQIEADTAPNP
nr:MAG: hypothetical protein E4H34_04855 [Hyphomicrobiales bacterium]